MTCVLFAFLITGICIETDPEGESDSIHLENSVYFKFDKKEIPECVDHPCTMNRATLEDIRRDRAPLA